MSADRAKKQLAEMINQQKQNVGITLYERRKNLIEDLRGTSGLQLAIIDSLEIEFLFNAEIYDSFNKILNEVDRLKKKEKDSKEYEIFLREENEEFYFEFCKLRNQKSNEADLEMWLKYCDEHVLLSYKDEVSGYKKLNYRNIYTDIIELEYLISCKKKELIDEMINYVKEEIGVNKTINAII